MEDGLPPAEPVGLARGRGDGVTLIENVFDRAADRLGEAESRKGDMNLGGGGNVVDTPKLPDVESAVGLLHHERMCSRGHRGGAGSRGRGRCRDHRGVG